MCGIAGYILNKNIKNKKNLDIHLLRMTDALKHRGPDACGYWKCNKSKIFLGHRRLSIIDLSSIFYKVYYFINVFNLCHITLKNFSYQFFAWHG